MDDEHAELLKYLNKLDAREQQEKLDISYMNIEKTRLKIEFSRQRDFPEVLYEPYKNMHNIYAYDTASFYEVKNSDTRMKLVQGSFLLNTLTGITGDIMPHADFEAGEKAIRDLICNKDNITNHGGNSGQIWEAVKITQFTNPIVAKDLYNKNINWIREKAAIPSLVVTLSDIKNPFNATTAAYHDNYYYKNTN